MRPPLSLPPLVPTRRRPSGTLFVIGGYSGAAHGGYQDTILMWHNGGWRQHPLRLPQGVAEHGVDTRPAAPN